MFGMGASEILVILVVALLFLGPEKLPEAASKISKGIRDLRKQTRELSQTIENDTEIGGAIRDLKSALRGDEPIRPRVPPKPPVPPIPPPGAEETAGAPPPPPAPRLPPTAGEEAPAEAEPSPDESNIATLVKPAPGTVAKT